MHRQFLLVLVLAILFFLLACNRTDIQYWDNGNLKSEIHYKNGKINGLAIWYYENGKKYYEANYIDEKLEGPLTTWHSNGYLKSREVYRNDMLNGKSIQYNTQGIKTEEVFFVNDTMHGEYRAWYDDRTKRIEGQYIYGMMDGRWFYWDQYGYLVGEGDFQKGTGVQKKYNFDGTLQGKLFFLNNEKHGKEVYYDSDGEVFMEINHEHGMVIGDTIRKARK